MKRNTITAFLTLIFIAFGAGAASAQFEGLINKIKPKVDKKTNQTTSVSTSNTTNVNNDDARWDLFKCKAEYVGSVNENKLREVVRYNIGNFYGNGGVIVFTKQPLTKKNPSFEDSVMTFKGGEPIYMTVVLPEAQEIDGGGTFISTSGDVITTVGDYQKQCDAGSFKNSLYIEYGRFDKMLPQTFSLDFQPADGKSAKYQQQIKNIAESLRALKPGVHVVPVRLSNNSGSFAVGAFYYDNRDGNGNDIAIKNALADVKMPASNAKYAALEKQMVAKLNEMPGAARAVRAVVTDSDWTPLRHEISGVLIGRAISAVTAIKNGDGRCYQEKQTWTQDYNGSAYTNLHLTGMREAQDMACENVSK